ncbi:MAG TPA: VWA domain-containing protein [Polyangiaceae bacterium]|nr:VWA domain-containing protein [Polyangiaceae bacterium]
MTLLGLPLGTLLELFAAAGGITLVLYILKLRRRPAIVVFAPLWSAAAGEKQSNALFSQLKRWLSLLLQLVLLALLISALGDPRLATVMRSARNVVLLIDASASMKAHDVEGGRMGAARRAAHELISGLSANDRMLIVRADSSVTPLTSLTSDLASLHTAVDHTEATDTGVDLGSALFFARDTLNGKSNPQVIIVSDGALPDFTTLSKELPADLPVRFVPVGSESDNVAITEFSVRRYPLDKSRAQAMIELTNFMQRPVKVQLTLLGDGDPIEITELSLDPQQSLSRFYSNLAGVDQTLQAQIKALDAKDWLSADDRAFALIPARRRAKVAVFSPGNTYLEAALLLDEYLQTSWLRPEQAAPKEPFDVAILDGVAPPSGLRANAVLYLNPPANAAIQRGRALSDFGFDSWDRNHPILRFTALDSVQVSTGFAFKLEATDHVLGSSEQGPIFVTGTRAGQRFAALGFDPRNSDMVLRPAWPLILLNTIDFFTQEEQRYFSNYPTGTPWHISVPAGFDTVTVKRPTGVSQPVSVKQGEITFLGKEAGFYELNATSAGGHWSSKLAADLSSKEESRIAPGKELRGAQGSLAKPDGFASGGRQQLWGYLLLAAFALSVLEWFSYHRRVSV